jgi:hypothetical protein
MFLRFLNRLFLALDANFRLKRRNVSSEEANPSFSDGWLYFVSESKYKAYLRLFSDLIIQKVFFIIFQIYMLLRDPIAQHLLQPQCHQC